MHYGFSGLGVRRSSPALAARAGTGPTPTEMCINRRRGDRPRSPAGEGCRGRYRHRGRYRIRQSDCEIDCDGDWYGTVELPALQQQPMLGRVSILDPGGTARLSLVLLSGLEGHVRRVGGFFRLSERSTLADQSWAKGAGLTARSLGAFG